LNAFKPARLFFLLFLALAGYYFYRMGDLYFHQAKYLYFPEKNWAATPDSLGLAYEDLALRSSDGVALSAWYVPVEASKGTVLFLHGNARNISSDLDSVQMFHGFGYNVLLVDYRGYGKSEGEPSEEGTYRDAQAAWDWLVSKKGESPERIVINGRSLGAAIAAELASRNAAKAVILEAAFTSLPDIGQEKYPYFPVRLLSRYRYDTLAKLKGISTPILLVHSRDDVLVPFAHGQRLYEAASGQKAFLEIGGPHAGGYKPTLQKYQDGIRDFLERYAPAAAN
jgi:uncharacterized protein